MPQKSNHDFKEKFPHVCAGTLKDMCIKDTLTKKQLVLPYASVLEY